MGDWKMKKWPVKQFVYDYTVRGLNLREIGEKYKTTHFTAAHELHKVGVSTRRVCYETHGFCTRCKVKQGTIWCASKWYHKNTLKHAKNGALLCPKGHRIRTRPRNRWKRKVVVNLL